MKFYTELPKPEGVETIDELVMAWILQGQTSEASRLSDVVASMFKENPSNRYVQGRCNCYCGCQHIFAEHDCQHSMKGTVVCDRCVDCHSLKIVFNSRLVVQ